MTEFAIILVPILLFAASCTPTHDAACSPAGIAAVDLACEEALVAADRACVGSAELASCPEWHAAVAGCLVAFREQERACR